MVEKKVAVGKKHKVALTKSKGMDSGLLVEFLKRPFKI